MILLEMAAVADHPVEGIIHAAAYHQPHSPQRLRLNREEVLDGKMVNICLNASPLAPLAFHSKVRTDTGAHLHVPLLDFHIEKSAHSLTIVHAVAARIVKGYYAILETQRSYHLVGTDLVDGQGLRQFLYRAILFSPITDHAYIAHQLLDDECTLRLTSRGEDTDFPTAVAIGPVPRRQG